MLIERYRWPFVRIKQRPSNSFPISSVMGQGLTVAGLLLSVCLVAFAFDNRDQALAAPGPAESMKITGFSPVQAFEHR